MNRDPGDLRNSRDRRIVQLEQELAQATEVLQGLLARQGSLQEEIRALRQQQSGQFFPPGSKEAKKASRRADKIRDRQAKLRQVTEQVRRQQAQVRHLENRLHYVQEQG